MYQYAATVQRWVDGDTVYLRVDLGFRTWVETSFRLYGVDTPERGQPLYEEACAWVNEHAPVGSLLICDSYKGDKYGRWLCDLHTTDGLWINQELIAAGLAREYFGGTKA